MGGPRSRTAQEALQRLQSELAAVIEALRAQRDLLRQRGMGLPPGALEGLKSAYRALQPLTGHYLADADELQQLRALARTTALVSSSLDLGEVLTGVMDTVIALAGAERGYLVLRDEDSGEMAFRIARNLDRQTIDESGFIVSQSIVSQVAQTGTPIITTDAQSDPQFGQKESVMFHALRSILCAPMVVKGEVTGVVYVDNRAHEEIFGEEHLALVMAFADQAAVAIDNARLFARMQRTLAEITEIKELMDNIFASIASGVITTDIRELVTTYNSAAERILGAPHDAVLGHSLGEGLPAIYESMRDVLSAIRERSEQAILEIDPELPQRGEANLTLKLTPLKNQDATEGVAIVVDDLTEIKRRDATLDVVRRYLPPAMLDYLPSLDGLALGGERRIITAVFGDVRPFDTFPASLRPQELMERLNLYLTVGAEAVHAQSGVVDKFMGNEIMGLFNTQLNPREDHACLAVQAALAMAEQFLALAQTLGEPPVPTFRIGVHTGVATLGNVGSASRREFTAIGDTVNLAKRLQENAAPGQIIISGETYEHCCAQFADRSQCVEVIPLPSIQVKGRRQAAEIFEVRRAPR